MTVENALRAMIRRVPLPQLGAITRAVRNMSLPAGASIEAPPRQAEALRYELKMIGGDFMTADIRSWLRVHPMGFRTAYPARLVNNVYFDSPYLTQYTENLAGVADRKKVRLRWYGEGTEQVQLTFEVKCKRGRVGWKLSQSIQQLVDLSMPWREMLEIVRNELTPDLRLFLETGGQPVLINRYQREYYETFDGIVRVTLDYDQKYFDQRFSPSPNLRGYFPPGEDAIVEFKAGVFDGELLARCMSALPLRVTRGSKYVRGVETLLGYELLDV